MAKTTIPKRDVSAAVGEDICGICKASHMLYYDPTPKNCSACGNRIKKQQFYYQLQSPAACWCSSCYTSSGEDLRMNETIVKKSSIVNSVQKQRNVETQAESWVACDGCNRWVHMVCGLFNKGNNKDDTKFLCPWCLKEMQRTGQWVPIKQRPQSMLAAEDLPRTELSDMMEAYVRFALPALLACADRMVLFLDLNATVP
jgi:E1A/CREB-binding protein